MEASGFKKRIEKSFQYKEFIKIIFQYPNSNRAIIKRGIVTEIFNDSFELEEIYDGLVTFSYDYIVEIKGDEQNIALK